MTDFIDPTFTPSRLSTYQGYHLQVFRSGRAKLTLQGLGQARLDYYAEGVKRDREAYHRQRLRSGTAAPGHFACVEALLQSVEAAKVFRVHAQGDNNKTADNAHILASRSVSSIWVVFEGVVHEWHVPSAILRALLAGTGPRVGQASLFHEYVPSYEHDWQDAVFTEDFYSHGLRWMPAEEPPPPRVTRNAPLPSASPDASRPTDTPAQPMANRSLIVSRPEDITDDRFWEDFDGDEPDPEAWSLAEEDEPFEMIPEEGEDDAPVGFTVSRRGTHSQATPYTKEGLWALMQR